MGDKKVKSFSENDKELEKIFIEFCIDSVV